MSEHLKAFLSAWLDWVDIGAPDETPYSRGTGLCSNFETYLFGFDYSWQEAESEVDGLTSIFRSEGLDKWYPFGGEDEYCRALCEDEQHLNESRIQWVRAKVSQFEVV